MSEHSTDVRPEVLAFVARVRDLMTDLPPDERQELTAGLEADLSELVAEHGAESLGDPGDYARELRTGAGHPPVAVRRAREWALPAAAMEALDAAHAHWDRLLDSLPGDLRGFLTALRPAWWVARAWVAWMVTQDLRGPYVVLDGLWLVVLAAYVVVSVQLGRRAWRVDRLLATSVAARLLLVGLNLSAVGLLPGAADNLAWHVAEERGWQFYGDATVDDDNAVTYQGGQACVLEVRDLQGRVIEGAYVWDATGERALPMNVDAC
ncbi:MULTISPECIES: HAAS signaling domain-containing protein [unclassified Nocardioides]|uniref:HAAS signaling domain-containing protein n=1 Tax=unclassified Nocardioides TaxID=2615069 RepID=UPI00301496B3